MDKRWLELGQNRLRYYSQTNEDGILDDIFDVIGVTNKVAVEFGAGDGINLSNTCHLRENGWTGFLFDGNPTGDGVHQEFITAANVNDVFKKHSVSQDFDLLSIDIDGNDYWVWKALTHQPRAIVIELNGTIDPTISKTIVYDPTFRHDGTDYYGSSLKALEKLGTKKGYVLVHQTNALNAFFVLRELTPPFWRPKVTYQRLQYHPPDALKRPWVVV